MTERIFYADSHQYDFSATVLSCEKAPGGFAVTIDRTAFFYEGGGQPADHGTLGDAAVTDVRNQNGSLVHFVDRPLAVGTTVCGRVDAARRFDFMQQHSGEHIVSGLAHRLFGAENVGFHLSEHIVTLDFDIVLNDAQIRQIEQAANEVVYRNAAFRAYFPDRQVLSTLTYRSKKEIEGAVRIVEIDGVDACACCAPHVNSAAEIGLIKLSSGDRLRGGIRLELLCGRRALADYEAKAEQMRTIGALLSAKQPGLADAVAGLQNKLAEKQTEIHALQSRVVALTVQNAPRKTAFFAENADGRQLQLLADALYKRDGEARIVFGEGARGVGFALCGNPDAAAELFAQIKVPLALRGGGRNGMFQGTSGENFEKIKFFFQNP